jgi:hypothetical protein
MHANPTVSDPTYSIENYTMMIRSRMLPLFIHFLTKNAHQYEPMFADTRQVNFTDEEVLEQSITRRCVAAVLLLNLFPE